MRILVKVTKKVLEQSKDCLPPLNENCMIAVAIREILPNATVSYKCKGFDMEGAIIRMFLKPEHIVFIPLPTIAYLKMQDFDARSPEMRVRMSPFRFELDVPNSVITHVGISEVYKILSESNSLELINI